MPRRIAFKRLVAVEVDPASSHQHELHADALRTQLGFPLGRTTGPMTVACYLGDDADAVLFEHGRFTLYNARAAHPTRSEYRLYYDVSLFAAALPGDFLVLLRQDGVLAAIVARAGTRIERELLGLLADRDDAKLDRFTFVDAPHVALTQAESIADALAPRPPVAADYAAVVGDEVDRIVRDGLIPATDHMAAIAQHAIATVHGPLGPDLRLFHGLEAESAIYFAAEERIQSSRLAELQARGADLAEITSFVMAILQSRRSRRGQSLQHHVAAVLRDESIPFSTQCKTERGERPDFVVPGCREYHDVSFPASRLRMIGCKATARERWRQLLNEAARIPAKCLVTLDPALTEATVEAMEQARLRVFVPAPIITANYRPPLDGALGTVAELLQELRAII